MQPTSAIYDPYSPTRRSDMRVSFRLIDTTAAGDATPSGTGTNTDISQIAQTHDGVEKLSAKWATLETNGWPLDGSCEIMPDDISEIQTGWWCEVSDENGEFATDPKLTFSFSEGHSSIGFTVFFDDHYPREMTVTAYDALDSVVATETVTVTGLIQVVEMPVENYRKLVISFSGTQKPYQSVRVVEVAFGIVQIYDKANSTGGTILYEVSPRSETQPTGELTITIDNTDRKYNMRSPSSLYAYLQQGQPLDAEIGIGGEYIPMGRFYFARSEARDRSMSATITAYDRFYQLDKSICRIGTTGTWTVAQAVAAVIADSGLAIPTSIPSAIGARTINKCIPSNASHREALRLIAQAGMSTCYFDRAGVLTFIALAAGTSVDTLTLDDMSEVPEPLVSDRINAVEIIAPNEYSGLESIYSASDIETGETVQKWTVYNALATGNDVAAWLLAVAQHRLTYDIQERGNPARELADTITIKDVDGNDHDVAVIKEEYAFDGALSARSRGWA